MPTLSQGFGDKLTSTFPRSFYKVIPPMNGPADWISHLAIFQACVYNLTIKAIQGLLLTEGL